MTTEARIVEPVWTEICHQVNKEFVFVHIFLLNYYSVAQICHPPKRLFVFVESMFCFKLLLLSLHCVASSLHSNEYQKNTKKCKEMFGLADADASMLYKL